MELAFALEQDIPIVPALLDNATMPPPEELPHDLQPLSHCQAIEIHGATFHEDATRLVNAILPRVREHRPSRRRGRLLLLAVAVAVAAIAVAAIELLPRRTAEPVVLRSGAALRTAEQLRASAVEHGFFSTRTNPAGRGSGARYRQDVRSDAALVHDETTGLTWQQGGSSRVVQGGRAGAESYVRELNGKAFGGFSDWRLPTVDEALSLMRPTPAAAYHLDPVFDGRGARRESHRGPPSART